MKKIEFSLHNALPTLAIERVGNDWHATIEFDWADSMDGTVFPSAIEDADGKIDGEFPDWVKALGEVGQLGTAAATMDFPERVYLGKIPEKFIGLHMGRETSMMAYDTEEEARRWSRSYDDRGPDTAIHLKPSEVTEEQVRESLLRSVREKEED